MAFYLSPLVDVQEIDLSTTIGAVSTSIGCIALRRTYKGIEKTARLVSTVEELLDTFGNPTSGSYEDIFTAMGYLKYGNKLYCTRCMPSTSTFAGAHGSMAASSALTVYTTSSSGAYTLTDFVEPDTENYGNETVPFGASREDASSAISFISATRGINGNYIKVAMIGRDVYTTISSGGSTVGMDAELTADVLRVDAPLSDDKDFIILVRAADQEDLNETTIPYAIKEYFVTSTNPTRLNDENKNIFVENIVNTESQYIRASLAPGSENTDVSAMYSTGYVTLAAGLDSNFADAAAQDVVVSDAYELYKNSDVMDVNLFIDGNKSTTIKRELNEHCETNRKDSVAILDCLKADVVDNLGSETDSLRIYSRQTLNINSSYSALYGNWLEIFDKWSAKYRWIPAAGHVAGIYANTDDLVDPWFAPAGLNRAKITNVRRLAWNPTQGERDILYKNHTNPIVAFSGLGKVIWGQKTLLNKESAFNRMNIRRLFITMEKAISTSLKYMLFEPNDSFTRLQIINMINPFLRDVRARRGIEDFNVVCDDTNNTEARIVRNELWLDVYIKPIHAAEFIVLNMVATRSGASFSEIMAII